MNLRECKGGRVKGSAEAQIASHSLLFAGCSCSLQFAVTSVLQITQVNAVASQMPTPRGNKCLILVEVRKGLYTKVYNYFPSDSEHAQDNLLNFLTSSCLRQTHPCWRATTIWSAMIQDLRLHWQVDF